MIITCALLFIEISIHYHIFRINPENSDSIIEKYINYAPYILFKQQFWRIFTSQFIHLNNMHLLSNIFNHLVFGYFVESQTSAIRYVIVYFGGGTLAVISSMLMRPAMASLGASANIYSLIGFWIGGISYICSYSESMIVFIAIILGLCIDNFIARKTGMIVDHYAHMFGMFYGILFLNIYQNQNLVFQKFSAFILIVSILILLKTAGDFREKYSL